MNTTPESIVVFDYRHDLGNKKFVRVHVRSVFTKDDNSSGGSTRKAHTDAVLREWNFLATKFKDSVGLAEISFNTFFPEYRGTIRINPIDDVETARESEGGAVIPNTIPEPLVKYLNDADTPVTFDYKQGHVLVAHVMHEPGDLLSDMIKTTLATPDKRKMAAMQLIHTVCGMHSTYGMPHGRVHISSVLVQKILEKRQLRLEMNDNNGNKDNEYSIDIRPGFLLTIAKTTGTIYDKDMYLEKHTKARMMYPWTFDPDANTETVEVKKARHFRNDAFDTCLLVVAILSETIDKIDVSKPGYASAVAEAFDISDTRWYPAPGKEGAQNATNDVMNFGANTNVVTRVKDALASLKPETREALKQLATFNRTGGSKSILVKLATAFSKEITQVEKQDVVSQVTFIVNTPSDTIHMQNSGKSKTRDDFKTVRPIRSPDEYNNTLEGFIAKS